MPASIPLIHGSLEFVGSKTLVVVRSNGLGFSYPVKGRWLIILLKCCDYLTLPEEQGLLDIFAVIMSYSFPLPRPPFLLRKR